MRGLGALTWIEVKLFAREPLTVLFVLVLPLIVLYVLNGVFGNQPSPEVYEGLGPIDFYTPAYVALVVATVGVLSLPVHLAAYREQGVLRRFRASALPAASLVGAHVLVAVLMGSVGALLMVALSVLAYDGGLPADPAGVLAAFGLSTLAFTALGVLLGLVLPSARAAQGLGVLLFFVFLMLGGAGPPREVLPDAMAHLGDLVPLTHAARLLRGPWHDGGWDLGALAVVTGLLVTCAAGVWWRLRTLES